jgi:O-antigen ligase
VTRLRVSDTSRPGPVKRRSDVVAEWVLRVAAFSIVVFLPTAFNPWVLPKEAVLLVAAALAGFAPAAGRLPRWLLGLILISAVILATAALMSVAPIPQLLGRFPRYEGVISLFVYFCALWVGSRLLGGEVGAHRRFVFGRSLAAVSIAIAVVSVAEVGGFRLWSQGLSRPGSLLGNATDQGVVGGMLACYLAVRVAREWRLPAASPPKRSTRFTAAESPFPTVELLGALSGVVTLAVSASRGALLGVGVALLLWVILETTRSARGVRIALGAVATAVVVFVVTAIFAPLVIARTTGTSPLAQATIADRVEMAKQALRLLAQHPLLGVGPSGFVDAATTVQGTSWFRLVGSSAVLDSPHLWILQAAMAGGIPLLVVACVLGAGSAVVGVRRWRAARTLGISDHRLGAGLALTVFGVSLLTDFTIASTTILAAIMLGALVSLPAIEARARARAWLTITRAGLLASAAIFIAMIAITEIPLASAIAGVNAGDIAVAREGFDTAAAWRPWDADVRSIAAQSVAAAADRGVTDAGPLAERYARDALRLTPDSADARLALAIALISQKKFTAAEAQLDLLHGRTPSDVKVIVWMADVASRQGDRSRAGQLVAQATAISPNDHFVKQAVQDLLG